MTEDRDVAWRTAVEQELGLDVDTETQTLDALDELTRQIGQDVDPELAPRTLFLVGVAAGRAFCGVFGNDRRREYTVHGNVMNLASRLMVAAGAGTGAASPRVSRDAGTGSRMVTNSSAAVGWMPTVASNCALVAPHFSATASP